MKRYTNMKDSGIKWIGEIPEGWKISSFKYFFNYGMGETILKEDLTKNGYPVYSATEENDIFGYFDDPKFLLKRGDLIVPARGNSIGYVKILERKGTCTQTTIYLSNLMRGIISRYVYYFCIAGKKELFQFDRTAIPQITTARVSSNPVLIPPKPEQNAIVAFLDEKTNKIDELVSKKERKIELLKEQRKALINQAVTKGLDPTVPMKDSGVEWIGEIPEGWELKKMKYVSHLMNEKGESKPDSIKISPENVDSFTGNVTNLRSDYSGEGVIFKECDILFNKLRVYLAKVVFAEYKGYSMGEMVVIRPFEIFEKFQYYILLSTNFIDWCDINSHGVKMPRTSTELIMNTSIPIPPENEQMEIVSYIDSRLNEIELLSNKESKKIELLKEYRQALISEVVTGKIDVSDYATSSSGKSEVMV